MSELTISQALRRVKKLKGRMGEHTARATGAVSYDVKAKPVFDFAAECGNVARVREELVTLEAAIAVANATNKVSFEGRELTIAEAIRRLQETKAEIAFLQGLRIQEGTVQGPVEHDWDSATGQRTLRRPEVTYHTDLKETDRVARIDVLRERFDRLNDTVETANHRTPVAWTEPKAPEPRPAAAA